MNRLKRWNKQRKCFHHQPGGNQVIRTWYTNGKPTRQCSVCRKEWKC